eukprot:1517085-Heterocapsa_arctica.AAC.1
MTPVHLLRGNTSDDESPRHDISAADRQRIVLRPAPARNRTTAAAPPSQDVIRVSLSPDTSGDEAPLPSFPSSPRSPRSD